MESELYLKLLEECSRCMGMGIQFLAESEKVLCPHCFGTGNTLTDDGYEVIRLLQWIESKKGYERGTD